jgi:tetratricopeptide (TPR) repeat protein
MPHPLAPSLPSALSRASSRAFALALVALAALTLSACGPKVAVQDPTDPPEGAPIQMEVEIIFKDGDQDAMMSRSDLFEEAHDRLARQDYPGCARAFDALWHALPSTDTLTFPSLYNAGLCYENTLDWPLAADRFQQALPLATPQSRDHLDTLFRLSEALANLARWDDVIAHTQAALLLPDLQHIDRLEGIYRQGMARIGLGQNDAAEDAFKLCLRENQIIGQASLAEQHYIIAGCHYGKALAYHMTFSALQFTLPEEQMDRDVDTKRQLSRRAYDQYLRTMRTRNHYWGILSGYMIGKLFEDFYYDILTSELPPDLSGQALTDYFVMLREDARILIDEAIALYRKTSVVSEQIHARHEWVLRAEDRLRFLEGYYDDEPLLRSEEAQIADLYARIQRSPQDAPALRHQLATLFRPAAAAPKLAPPPSTSPNPASPNSLSPSHPKKPHDA